MSYLIGVLLTVVFEICFWWVLDRFLPDYIDWLFPTVLVIILVLFSIIMYTGGYTWFQRL